jgi:3-deoxy-D-manno-octulosonic-acid transferase
MYFLYSILLVSWGILLIPALIYRAWRHHKHIPGLSQRFGRLPESLKSTGRSTIWFHSCSVGETLSLQPLVHALHQRFPEARFVFSTITQTGQLIAAKNFEAYGKGNTFYFPVDLASITGRVLDEIRPAMIVIIDTEIWPNLVNQAHRRRIPVVLANGRISASSFRYYRLAKPVLGRVFRNYRTLMMQSEEDARRIAAIGAPSEKILVTGNIKFDKSVIQQETNEKSIRDLEAAFGLAGADAPLIVAGSTHPGEEEILLEMLQRIRQMPELSRTRLLLAPRHPERFEEVAGLIARKGFALRRRTDGTGHENNADILLLDTLGELAAVYRFAAVVFVGGTLVRHGGHSIMEPALYSKAIVVGPSMENFRGIVEEFRANGAIRQIHAGEEDRQLQIEELTREFSHLLQNAQERDALGARAFSILEKNRGAAKLTAEQIATIFEEIKKNGDGCAIPAALESRPT